MGSVFSREVIEEIKRRVDIVSLIERHVSLERVGSRFRGVCPFHSETKPSFYVNPDLGLFYCFGCQASGDVIDFYCKINGVDFPQAVIELAQEMGIDIEVTSSDGKVFKRKLFFELNSLASAYFSRSLLSDKRAQIYLKDRGISSSMVEAFKLGYALDRWDGLRQFFISKGYSLLDAVDAGLLVKNERDRIYDRFRNRLMFPIHDISGRVVGFGGRILGDGDPKYLNTSENIIFKKGQNLYGLYHARREISRQKEVIITEGYVDVITLFQYGFCNSCGVLGTALTPHHVKRLSHLCNKAVLVFDGDEAGIKAAIHSSEMFLTQGMNVSVVMLPEGEDIDSFLRFRGREEFLELIEGAREGLAFCMEMIKLKKSPGEVVRWCREFLSSFSDPTLRGLYVSRIAKELGISNRELEVCVPGFPERSKASLLRRRGDGLVLGDRELLRFAICYPEYIPAMQELDLSLVLKTQKAREMWDKLRNREDELLSLLSEEEKGFYVESLFLREREDKPEEMWKEIKVFLKKKKREALLREAREGLAQAQRDGDEERMRFYLTQINSLLKGGE